MNETVTTIEAPIEKPKVGAVRWALVILFLFVPAVIFMAITVVLTWTIIGIPLAAATGFTSYAFILCGMMALGRKNIRAFARYAEQKQKRANSN